MDPTQIGMMMIQAMQNPQMAPALDQAGVPPPGALGGDAGGMGSLINPQGGGGTGNPAALMALAGMQGVKAPTPITPIMYGGVTGGVKPPEANVQATQGGSQAINALIQSMLQRQNPLAVPALGDFIRGRGGY